MHGKSWVCEATSGSAGGVSDLLQCLGHMGSFRPSTGKPFIQRDVDSIGVFFKGLQAVLGNGRDLSYVFRSELKAGQGAFCFIPRA